MRLQDPHIWMRGRLVDAIAVGVVLGFTHQLVEFTHSQRAPLTTGKHLRFEQEPAVNVDHHLRSTLLGRFNLSNVLAAVGALLGLDYALDEILKVLPKLEGPAGRMQRLGGGVGAVVAEKHGVAALRGHGQAWRTALQFDNPALRVSALRRLGEIPNDPQPPNSEDESPQ